MRPACFHTGNNCVPVNGPRGKSAVDLHTTGHHRPWEGTIYSHTENVHEIHSRDAELKKSGTK